MKFFQSFVNRKYLALASCSALTFLLMAVDSFAAGKTANGCSYQVINGKYVTNCRKNATATKAAPTQTTQYANLPVKNQQNRVQTYTVPVNQSVKVVAPEAEARASGSHRASYGYAIGLSTQYQSTSLLGIDTIDSSANGFGLGLEMIFDDYIAFYLQYNYSSLDLYLDLVSRSEGGIQLPSGFGGSRGTNETSYLDSDSKFTAHLLTLESQFHLLDAESNIRPFAGAGIGLKKASLSEDFPYGTSGAPDASVSQLAFGAIGSVGAKFRFLNNFQIAAAFRMFLPISTQDPDWGNKSFTNGNGDSLPSTNRAARSASQENLFRAPDADLTSATITQIQFGVSYFF